jgi:hypothetical protein
MNLKKFHSMEDYHVAEITDDLTRINGGSDNMFSDLGIAVGRGLTIAARWIYDKSKYGCAWGY